MKKMFAIVLGLFAAALFVEPAFAQMINLNDNPSEVAGATTAWGGDLRSAVLTLINFFLFFLGLVATGFIIYGGFLYVTSQGDDGNVETAKKILMFAAIGILIILVSFALVNTILQAGSGVRV